MQHPKSSFHSSRSSFETAEEMTREYMEADAKDYRSSKHRLLVRDNFRCILTGMFDYTSTRKSSELSQRCDDLCIANATVIACHIVNELTAHDPADGGGDTAVERKPITSSPSFVTLDLRIWSKDSVHQTASTVLEICSR